MPHANSESRRKWNNTPERKLVIRDQNLRGFYGISLEQFEEMAKAQGGVCKICGKPEPSGPLHVDHCHETFIIRGLLCDRCNRGAGYFREDPAILRRAADYFALASGPKIPDTAVHGKSKTTRRRQLRALVQGKERHDNATP